jgi:uncharacterized protein YbjT (DUF2867 family)
MLKRAPLCPPESSMAEARSCGAGAHARTNVLVLGGTGLVGTHLLRLAAHHPAVGGVVAFVRSMPKVDSIPNVRWLVVDFDNIEADTCAQEALVGVDVMLCALGTTIRKAGSREAFEKIDLELPLRIARMARDVGVNTFGVVSSVGASPDAAAFYSRTKGRMEEALEALELQSLSIVRPSLLLGERRETRFGEDVAKALTRPISALIPKSYRPVQASRVARALLDATLDARRGARVIPNAELFQ